MNLPIQSTKENAGKKKICKLDTKKQNDGRPSITPCFQMLPFVTSVFFTHCLSCLHCSANVLGRKEKEQPERQCHSRACARNSNFPIDVMHVVVSERKVTRKLWLTAGNVTAPWESSPTMQLWGKGPTAAGFGKALFLSEQIPEKKWNLFFCAVWNYAAFALHSCTS